MPPEPPQVRLRTLIFARGGDRHDTVLARVQRRSHTANRPAFACCIITLEHGHQRVPAHVFVAQQAGQASLLGHQLLLVVLLVQVQGHVQRADQAALIDAAPQRRDVALVLAFGVDGQCGLQAFQQDAPNGQAAVVGVGPFNYMPRCIVTAGTAQHPLAKTHETVVGLRLLPVQRADAPAVQGVVLERFEPRFHLFLGQVEPELDDQRTFVAKHLLQALGAGDCLVEHRILELPMHPALQHLAVPVAEKNAHAPLGREHSPVAPRRRP
ncbi:hypothetical protein D3C81_1340680 [compost metagenome]